MQVFFLPPLYFYFVTLPTDSASRAATPFYDLNLLICMKRLVGHLTHGSLHRVGNRQRVIAADKMIAQVATSRAAVPTAPPYDPI
jgi:cytochrome c biogenesis factor